jgi:hypothetical protein
MKRQRLLPPLTIGILLSGLWWSGCDDTVTLLDLDALRKHLDLTAAQTETVSGHVRRILGEVEGYIQAVRQREQELSQAQGRRVDERTLVQDPAVEAARQSAVAHIQTIAAEIRRTLTPEQQAKFDRIMVPDLRQSPQELEFMMVQSRQGTFTALQVKPSTKIEPAAFSPDTPDTTRYHVLKEQRTIVFGPGGFNSGLQNFPIFVTAILVDSLLTEAENRYTAPPDSLDGPAGQARRAAYFTARQAKDMFAIRLVLSTFLHESYASMDRWVAYIEDQDGNRYEPTRVVEELSVTAPDPSSLVPRGYLAEGDVPLARKARQFEIRFPYRDPLGHRILGPGTQSLRLVLFDKNDPQFRTQGEWVMR